MNLNGYMFKNAMMYNFITVKDQVISIHNTDEEGYGFITYIKTDEVGELTFTLSKKDYQMLSHFDVFNLTVSKDVIKVKAKNSNINLANLIDIKAVIPDTKDARTVDVKPNDFLKGKSFVGNSKTKIQVNGVNVSPDGYLLTDSYHFYMQRINTGVSESICIPKEIFGFIKDMATCMTDNKTVVFINDAGNQLFYSSLLSKAQPLLKLDTDTSVVLKCKTNDLFHQLCIMKGYTDYVNLKQHDNILHLYSHEETNIFDLEVESKFIKGSKLNVTVNLEHLIRIIELETNTDIELRFADRMMLYACGSISAGDMYVAQQEPREVE